LPVEVSQPRVVLDFKGAIQTQSVQGFPLNHLKALLTDKPYFVDEVSCFQGPSPWYFISLDLDLFGQDVVSDLLS
jgi:hypothetical protein